MSISGRYILIVLGIALIPFVIPALAGAGFLVAAAVSILLILALLGLPLGWELKMNREMGAKGRRRLGEDRIRDFVAGRRQDGERDTTDRRRDR
jgi:uncharacterized membrane protein